MPNTGDRPARRRWARTPLLIIGLFFWAGLAAQAGEAPTVDEQAHLARGLTYPAAAGRPLYIGHPPLINLIAAAPLWPDTRIAWPADDPTWQQRDWIEFPITLFWKLDNPARAMFAAGRLMILLLGALLLAVLYRLGADLGGPTLGAAAVLLAALDPNLRAHARLVTTDLGLGLTTLLAAWLWRRWLQHPRPARAAAAGLALGLALTSKYPALIWAAGLALAVLVAPAGRRNWRQAVLAGGVAALTIWAVYGFEVRAPAGWPLPLPAASYLEEFGWSLTEIARTPAYLLGQVSRDGFYSYFLVAFLTKLPLPLLALALAGLWRARQQWRAGLLLGLPAVVFLGAAVAARINIGYRHSLPVWPLIYLAGGAALAALWSAPRAGRWLAGLLAGWLALGSALVYPRDLTYFNELAGGPDQGWRVLVDSNLDWGQDLGALVDFVQARGLDALYVSYFGSVPVGSIPVREFPLPARPLPPRPAPDWSPLHPAPGWYAISVTHLLGGAVLDDPDTFAFFRHRQPEAILGRTLYVYQIPEETGTLAVCVNPPPSLGADAARRLFGGALTRALFFDCDRGLPLPAGRTWYLLRGEQTARLGPALERLGAQLLFDQPHAPDPAFAFSVYGLEEAAARAAAYSASAQPPAEFGGQAAFLGWRYAAPPAPGRPAQVETVWQVRAGLTEPVSLFLHLTAADGFPLAVSDGLNTPFDTLQAGDALIQFHPLEYPADLPAGAQFRAGLYALGGAQARYRLPDGADYVAFGP